MSTNNLYAQYKYLLMTLDPVHIGTGGYRLGRVDNSIIREPGTNIPKIPGTSLSGAIRHYAAYQYGKIQCAGKGDQSSTFKHCGNPTCPICYSFGYTRGDQGGHAGTVNIFDAHILFFPVHSMAGPVWVTTKDRLGDAGFTVKLKFELEEKEIQQDLNNAYITSMNRTEPLNLGWLMLEVYKNDDEYGKLSIEVPKTEEGINAITGNEWDAISQRLVIVSDKIFSQVVNSNLEVRTSVSINPQTGAAEEGALFTYEAIPRATWLVMDVVVDDYRNGFAGFPSKGQLEFWRLLLDNNDKENTTKLLNEWRMPTKTDDDCSKSIEEAKKLIKKELSYYSKAENLNWGNIISLVEESMKLAEVLGVGGMGTRGFGRLKSLDNWEVKNG